MPLLVLFKYQRAGLAWLRALAAPIAPELCGSVPLGLREGAIGLREGAGKAGHRLAPMVRVQQKSTRQNHRFSREYPAFPARMVLTAYSALSLVTGLFCHHHSQDARSVFANLAPASGRQDHTAWPSARAPVVCCRTRVHRIPLPRS